MQTSVSVFGKKNRFFVANIYILYIYIGFPGSSMVKNPPGNAEDAGDADSVPGSGRSHGGSHGNPLQYSFLENPMDRGAWWAVICGATKRIGHNLVTK